MDMYLCSFVQSNCNKVPEKGLSRCRKKKKGCTTISNLSNRINQYIFHSYSFETEPTFTSKVTGLTEPGMSSELSHKHKPTTTTTVMQTQKQQIPCHLQRIPCRHNYNICIAPFQSLPCHLPSPCLTATQHPADHKENSAHMGSPCDQSIHNNHNPQSPALTKHFNFTQARA
jgi:hypothetical protein